VTAVGQCFQSDSSALSHQRRTWERGITPPPGESRKGANIAVYIIRTFETRAARMALLFIRHPIKSRGYLAKHERLITARDLAGLER
jgi:hypothetical protein